MLTELQKDAFQEFMNVGIGRAGSLLSEMIESRVDLSITNVEILMIKSGQDSVRNCFMSISDGHVISSSLRFGQKFNGKAHLLFPMERVHKVLNCFIGEYEAKYPYNVVLSDADVDVMREIGNVILNTVMGSLGELLDMRLEYFVPDVEFFDLNKCDVTVETEEESYLVIIQTYLYLREINVDGAILIILSLTSPSFLVEKIDRLLGMY